MQSESNDLHGIWHSICFNECHLIKVRAGSTFSKHDFDSYCKIAFITRDTISTSLFFEPLRVIVESRL